MAPTMLAIAVSAAAAVAGDSGAAVPAADAAAALIVVAEAPGEFENPPPTSCRTLVMAVAAVRRGTEVPALGGGALVLNVAERMLPVRDCRAVAADAAAASRSLIVVFEEDKEVVTMFDTAVPTMEITPLVAVEREASEEAEPPPLVAWLPLTEERELLTDAARPRMPTESIGVAVAGVEERDTVERDSGTPIVYVPTPPAPEPSAVTTVPGITPAPVTGMPTVTVPELMEVTVSVLPEMEATMLGAAGGAAAVMVVAATVCGVDTV